MSHEISIVDGKAEMAFVGDRSKIWHGLGQELSRSSSIEVWQKESGMNWDIHESDLVYNVEAEDGQRSFEGKKVLFRSDNKEPLAVVGSKYKLVQPKEVLEFFRDLVSDSGMELSTAGVLFSGRQFWALADAKQSIRFDNGDTINGYVLLNTSCDGSMSTTAQFTSTRVVCNNTLNIALNGSTKGASINRISTSHRTEFQPNLVKSSLGIYESSWDKFSKQMRSLAEVKLSAKDAYNNILSLVSDDVGDPSKAEIKVVNDIHSLFLGGGMGADLAGKTAYGLINAFTEYNDYNTGRNPSRRLQSQFWGPGSKSKQAAFEYITKKYSAVEV